MEFLAHRILNQFSNCATKGVVNPRKIVPNLATAPQKFNLRTNHFGSQDRKMRWSPKFPTSFHFNHFVSGMTIKIVFLWSN